MFRLTKLIDSKSSIEASLKNARFAHRLFNHNSIKPAQFSGRKLSTGLVRSLTHGKGVSRPGPHQSTDDKVKNPVETLKVINSKLSNDDYIYATYQLTRDRILRVKRERLKKKISGEKDTVESDSAVLAEEETSEKDQEAEAQKEVSASKENNSSRLQRKPLQPQHKMRDKFTSFFRSGSTSPNGSFSVPCDLQSGSETHHEAFNDHNNEMSSSIGRYFISKTDNCDNSMAFALPLARKCSLVSEEGACSTDSPDNK